MQTIKELIKLNLKQRRTKVDDSYFDAINTEEKAYFLGLLYADGCNSKTRWNTRRISIRLIEVDKDLILKFKDAVKSTAKITKSKTGRMSRTQSYGININSTHMSYALKNLGCRT